jgi:hypothetical protein
VPNASVNRKRIIRVFRSSVEIRVLRCDAAWFRRVATIAMGSDDMIIIIIRERERDRERERAIVLKEGADARGVGHILSYIEWYHIIGMDTKLILIET